MITENEKKLLRFLLANFDKDYSINELARKCGLAPNGAYEILTKLEGKKIAIIKEIAHIKSYKLNFNNIETCKLLELTLIPNYEDKKIKYRYDDLKPLKDITSLCILFGSYITKKENPNDIDALFVIDKHNYKKYQELLDQIRTTLPLKLHDILQTPSDFKENIKKADPIVREALAHGIILWGHELTVEVIRNVSQH